MSWQFQADQPIYTQLVARLQQQIVSGGYPPGCKLPSVRDLASDAARFPDPRFSVLDFPHCHSLPGLFSPFSPLVVVPHCQCPILAITTTTAHKENS